MTDHTQLSDEIRAFILDAIPSYPTRVADITCERFMLNPEDVDEHLDVLIKDGLITAEDDADGHRVYALPLLSSEQFTVLLEGLDAHALWRDKAAPHLNDLPQNAKDIWAYVFTEVVNNAVVHSRGTNLDITIEVSPVSVTIKAVDDGVGIFKKIRTGLRLANESDAVLELSRGRVTTNAENHAGQGIFFVSRMLDQHAIHSGNLFFSHNINPDQEAASPDAIESPAKGTAVLMRLSNSTQRTTKDAFLEWEIKLSTEH